MKIICIDLDGVVVDLIKEKDHPLGNVLGRPDKNYLEFKT